MRNLHMSAKAVIIGLAALFVGTTVAQAQEMEAEAEAEATAEFENPMDHRWVGIQAHGGIALPMGDLGDVAEAGPSVGVDFDYYINDRWLVGVSGQLSDFAGRDDSRFDGGEGPGMRQWAFDGHLGVNLADPDQGFQATLSGGGGLTVISTDGFPSSAVNGAPLNITETFPALRGGLQLSGALSPDWHVFATARARYVFTDEDEFTRLTNLYSDIDELSSTFSIPITAGIRVTMPSQD